MGFGCLFIGYFFANMMPPVGSPLSVLKLIGYPLVVAALYRLAPYHKRFLYCFFVSLATLPFALYYGMFGLSSFGVFPAYAFLSGTFYNVVQIVYLTVSLAVHLLLLLAVAGLGAELKLSQIRANAWRNLTFVGAYFLLRVLMLLPVPALQRLIGPTLLIWICMIFLNLFLLFRCYRYICPEGDEDMPDRQPVKPTSRRSEDGDES